jgi:hypothetical protein
MKVRSLALAIVLVPAFAWAAGHHARVDAQCAPEAGARGMDHVQRSALTDVAAVAATRLHGEVTSVALDGAAAAPRYDVDVRVAAGRSARLVVDPATSEFGWRSPPVVFR